MGIYITLGLIGAYVILSLLLLPMQYRYIKQLKEADKRRREQGIKINEHYDKMSFETQQLHLNAQGNLLFLGANLLATLVFRWKEAKKE